MPENIAPFGPKQRDDVLEKFGEPRLKAIEEALGIEEPDQELRAFLAQCFWKALGKPRDRRADHQTLVQLRTAVEKLRVALNQTFMADDDAPLIVTLCGGDLSDLASRVDDFDDVLERALDATATNGCPPDMERRALLASLKGIERHFTGRNTVYSKKGNEKEEENEFTGPLFLMFRTCSEVVGGNQSDAAIAKFIERSNDEATERQNRRRRRLPQRREIESPVEGVLWYRQSSDSSDH